MTTERTVLPAAASGACNPLFAVTTASCRCESAARAA
jgi:hypothetical protein